MVLKQFLGTVPHIFALIGSLISALRCKHPHCLQSSLLPRFTLMLWIDPREKLWTNPSFSTLESEMWMTTHPSLLRRNLTSLWKRAKLQVCWVCSTEWILLSCSVWLPASCFDSHEDFDPGNSGRLHCSHKSWKAQNHWRLCSLSAVFCVGSGRMWTLCCVEELVCKCSLTTKPHLQRQRGTRGRLTGALQGSPLQDGRKMTSGLWVSETKSLHDFPRRRIYFYNKSSV